MFLMFGRRSNLVVKLVLDLMLSLTFVSVYTQIENLA